MKTYFRLLTLSIAVCMASCSFLDEEPYHYISEQDIFTTEANYTLASNQAYSYMPDGFNCVSGAFLDCATDDAMGTVSNSKVHNLARGFISADNTIYSLWTPCYRGIRQAMFAQYGLGEYNTFIAKKTEDAIAAMKMQYYQEMNCLRAYYEFELLRMYGGFPIVDKLYSLDEQQEATNQERDSFEDCVEHIVGLCDSAAKYLYVKSFNDNAATGRMTKGAALAIKAKTLAYAASPLFNVVGNANPLIGYTDADSSDTESGLNAVQARWRRAAAAAADVINLCADGSINAAGNKAYKLVACKNSAVWNSTAFLTGNPAVTEWIVMKTAAKSNSLENRHYPPTLSKNSGGGTVPTQELVNAFTKSNGESVAEPKNGEPTLLTGRDSRFDAFIAYDGYNALRQKIYTRTGTGATADGLNATTDLSTTTGYYMAKFLSPKLNFTASSVATQFHVWPVIRLSDIYLLYAEAMTNGYEGIDVDPEGYGLTALGAVKAVRARALFGASDNFYQGVATNNDFMQLIKQERRVELCFEGQRYYDLRRWLDAQEVLNRPVHGIEINYNDKTPSYTYFEADSRRNFTEKMYLHPIPRSVLKENPNVKQNPGY